MKLALHLLRRHRLVYLSFWGILCFTFAVMVATLHLIAPWVRELDEPSTWLLINQQAPMWFLFVMGIILSSTHLPVFIAHGVTRREFFVSAGIFAIVSTVLFGLATLAGYAVEAFIYHEAGIMAQLENPYPTPTVESTGHGMLIGLGFMISGFLIGLAFYRLRPWKAIALAPLASLPLYGGLVLPFEQPWLLTLGLVVGAAALAFAVTSGTPIRPRKA